MAMGYEKRLKRRRVRPADIPSGGRFFDITVESMELPSIAQRLKVVAVHSLQVVVSVRGLLDSDIYRIDGSVTSDIEMQCGVTLENFISHFSEDVFWDVSFDSRYDALAERASGQDLPEYVRGEDIDVVEFAVQSLGLALPAYPRRAGAELSDWSSDARMASLLKSGHLVFSGEGDSDSANNSSGSRKAFGALGDLMRKGGKSGRGGI